MDLDKHHVKEHLSSNQEVGRDKSMIYDPWPLVEGMRNQPPSLPKKKGRRARKIRATMGRSGVVKRGRLEKRMVPKTTKISCQRQGVPVTMIPSAA